MTARSHVVAKLLTISRMFKVDYQNKVLPLIFSHYDVKMRRKLATAEEDQQSGGTMTSLSELKENIFYYINSFIHRKKLKFSIHQNIHH